MNVLSSSLIVLFSHLNDNLLELAKLGRQAFIIKLASLFAYIDYFAYIILSKWPKTYLIPL